MQAVILAAGLGTRMGELTKDTPKPLLKVKSKDEYVTILSHNLNSLPVEIDEVILIVGYLKEQIMEYLKKDIGSTWHQKNIIYKEQKVPKGTADALFQAKDILKDRFLVLMGDDLYDKQDLAELVRHDLGILVWEMLEDNLESQAAIVKIEEGLLAGITERQPVRKGVLLNTGAYILNTDIFKHPLVSAGTPAAEFGLPQTMMQMTRDGAKFDIVRARWWRKVTSPEDLKT